VTCRAQGRVSTSHLSGEAIQASTAGESLEIGPQPTWLLCKSTREAGLKVHMALVEHKPPGFSGFHRGQDDQIRQRSRRAGIGDLVLETQTKPSGRFGQRTARARSSYSRAPAPTQHHTCAGVIVWTEQKVLTQISGRPHLRASKLGRQNSTQERGWVMQALAPGCASPQRAKGRPETTRFVSLSSWGSSTIAFHRSAWMTRSAQEVRRRVDLASTGQGRREAARTAHLLRMHGANKINQCFHQEYYAIRKVM